MISDLVLMVRGVVSFIAMGYVLRTFGIIPLAVIVVVFIPVLVIRWRNSARLYDTRQRTTEETRQASYFSWLLTGEKPAREVRLFGLGDYFERLFRKHFSASREPEIASVRKNAMADSIAAVVRVADFAGVLFYATASFLREAITAGELAMYIVAFRQALVYLRDAVSGYSGLTENSLFLRDLFGFLDLRGEMAGEEIAPDPDSLREIAVENLSFTFPGASRPALEDISLHITRGEKVAVVGRNGSGKTTLVKLLCRLYDPDSGCIKLNGRHVETTDRQSTGSCFRWSSRTSCCTTSVPRTISVLARQTERLIRSVSATPPPGPDWQGSLRASRMVMTRRLAITPRAGVSSAGESGRRLPSPGLYTERRPC